MKHSSRMIACLIGAFVVVAVLVAVGVSRLFALPLLLITCPLMIVMMMRGMNHTDRSAAVTRHPALPSSISPHMTAPTAAVEMTKEMHRA